MASTIESASCGQSPRVLVVDDDPGILRLARKSLQRAGCCVFAYTNVKLAREHISADAPDMLVLDYQLSGVETGLDFFRRLRREGVTLPAVLVTGYTDESRVIEALRAGVSDVVPKTDDYLEYLPEAVERVLSQVKLQRESAEALLLRDREAHYRSISEALPHLVLSCNAEGVWDFFSKQWYAYTGLDEPTSRGCGWIDAVHPDDREALHRCWRDTVASDDAASDKPDVRIRGANGAYRWFGIRVSGLRDTNGEITRWFGSFTDIHAQHEANVERERLLSAEQSARQTAEEANRAKDRFLAMLSHELRTPLTPVLAGTRVLELMPDLSEGAQASVRMIRRNIELEARLIDDLLDLTRVANGKLRLSLETVDVHEAIDGVLDLFRSEFQLKQLDVTIEKAAEHHHVLADRARLQQMLWNLVRNAAKFTPDGGYIYVRTHNTRSQIEISIEDTGIGIAPEQIGKLFNAFEQGSQRMTQQFGGLGLGLAITKALADAHGGKVNAESPGPHCGATFKISLPIAAAPASKLVVAADATSDAEERLDILLVEDHADTAEVMAHLMSSLGHEVTVATCVADALAATERAAFDLIVSDVGLPDGTGIEFIAALRKRGTQVPAVALTGYGTDDDIRRCLEAGFTAHLTKPVNFSQLEEQIRRAAASIARGGAAHAAQAERGARVPPAAPSA
jgi:PAS domain S-box-containing protein